MGKVAGHSPSSKKPANLNLFGGRRGSEKLAGRPVTAAPSSARPAVSSSPKRPSPSAIAPHIRPEAGAPADAPAFPYVLRTA
jgi:hypothetical protein